MCPDIFPTHPILFKEIMSFINAKEISCFGMRRSGNHAVLNWIRKQIPGTFVHLNNAKIYGNHDPYISFSEIVVSDLNPFVFESGPRKVKRFAKYLIRRGKVQYTYGRPDFGRLKIEALRQHPKSLLIHSYEHYSLKMVLGEWFDTEMEQYLGRSQSKSNIVLLRDPYNLFASLIKKKENFSNPKSIIGKWNEHAREYLGHTSYLANRVSISYNSWFKDQDYRRELANRLGIEFTDAGLDSVPIFGRGSSFDGQKYSGQARKMGVLSRYKQFLDHPVMKEVMADEELRELSYEAFGDILSSTE